MLRAGIAGKVWRTVGLFAAGTLVSLAVSQLAGVRAEKRLRVTNEALFPAAQYGQQAVAAFERMARAYQDAIMLEEATAIERARQDGLAAAGALQAAAARARDPERAKTVAALAADLSSFVQQAGTAYAPMIQAGDTLTPEMEATSRRLAGRTAGLRRGVNDASEQLAADLRAELDQAVRSSVSQRRLSLLVFLVALGACSVVVLFTIRGGIVRPIRLAVVELTETATQVATSSNQVATSAQSLSQGATEQAASLEETSASMEEVAAMTRKNAENSQSAASMMAEVDHQVKAWNQSLSDMVAAMGSIQESSGQVARIIKTIDEIAFQTNILALNAAVEAARAGDAGMGFAIVADEVRNLAQRSAQAARDTAGLIETSIGKAQAGNRKVEQLNASIAGIIGSIASVKVLVDEVSAASLQQTQGIDHVSHALAQMERVTQNTAATAEESAAASEELSAQAENSMAVVGRLDALLGTGLEKRPGASVTSGLAAVARALPLHAGRRPSREEAIPLGPTGSYGGN
jgi:methyl-accepting chemotaxis protein